jgi:hypothetical protein
VGLGIDATHQRMVVQEVTAGGNLEAIRLQRVHLSHDRARGFFGEAMGSLGIPHDISPHP